MSLHDQITQDVTVALKAHDGERANVLRFLLSGLHNRVIEKKAAKGSSVLTDEEVRDALQREAKRRREAQELFKKGGRMDLVEREEKDLSIIESYLPPPMSRDDVVSVVERLIASGITDFPSLMREAMKELKGRADGTLVGSIVKEKIG